ncbi:MAG TPA: tripartite tricarboxylate transporter substrate binding protein [Ramlibacter sp.]|nr:tripartite tricarboxylate transporter substrate binding protein [Ramlibacter sp.]
MLTLQTFIRWLALAFALCWTLPGAAQNWPQNTVRIVDPYGPGSTTDLVGRLIADKLQKRTGQPFIVESKAGAGGIIGTTAIARSAPDGYVFGLATAGPLAHSVMLRKSMPFDPMRDLAPLTLAVHQPMLLVSSTTIAQRSLPALIAEFKKHPSKYNYALVGTGSLSHLLMVRLLESSGLSLEPIAYPGGPNALLAVIRGDVQIACLPAFIALAQAKAGKVNLLAVSSAQRSPFLPDVPTLSELGFPDVVGTGWIAAIAPANTPKPLLDTMRKMIVEALREPDVVEILGKNMIEVIAGTPEQYNAYVRDEIQRWKPVIERNDIKN